MTDILDYHFTGSIPIPYGEDNFAFFSIGLSHEQQSLLKDSEVSYGYDTNYPSFFSMSTMIDRNADGESNAIRNMLGEVYPNPAAASLSYQIVKEITQATSNLYNNYYNTLLTVRAYNGEVEESLRWHYDSSFIDEKIGNPVVSFVLNGNPTLVLDSNSCKINKVKHEDDITSYNITNIYECDLIQANQNEAMVFLAGKQGTIHSAPSIKIGEQRLFVAITPVLPNSDYVNQFLQLINVCQAHNDVQLTHDD